MTQPDLWLICVFAFIAVFTLLGLLAIVMRALTVLFPGDADPSDMPDAALVAAVSATAALGFRGLRVTRVEEVR